eukprot:TRINITY_DN2450_c0_g1_i2.p1 TRINITY_DN2450_c0_g1~~TRINITY_DN2450_c0_g1_i2.p1  ORF type:complete len:322 (+),score=41.66 TRINITY_DN2450_c0_g1_i2:250-1215(+)
MDVLAKNAEDDLFDVDLGESVEENEEFEFRVSVSRAPGTPVPVDLSPADDLFCNGLLLPLHHRNLTEPTVPPASSPPFCLLFDSTSSSSESSSCNSSVSLETSSCRRRSHDFECDFSGRAMMDKCRESHQRWRDAFLVKKPAVPDEGSGRVLQRSPNSLSFSERCREHQHQICRAKSEKSKSPKEILHKYLYLKMMKPLCEMLHSRKAGKENLRCAQRVDSGCGNDLRRINFSGNLQPKRSKWSSSSSSQKLGGSSCPSSMRSSPTHSGLLVGALPPKSPDMSTMEDLQNAIQGAIAHCKKTIATSSENRPLNEDASRATL